MQYRQLFNDKATLMRKIGRWWIVEIEVPTNPKYDGRHVEPSRVDSARVVLLSLIADLALGTLDDATGPLAGII